MKCDTNAHLDSWMSLPKKKKDSWMKTLSENYLIDCA